MKLDKDTLHREWGTVYLTSHRGLAHLDPNCMAIRGESVRKKVIDKYPPEHLDICSYCQDHFLKWRNGLSADPEDDNCDRCGQPTKYEYCDSCQKSIDRRKATRNGTV